MRIQIDSTRFGSTPPPLSSDHCELSAAQSQWGIESEELTPTETVDTPHTPMRAHRMMASALLSPSLLPCLVLLLFLSSGLTVLASRLVAFPDANCQQRDSATTLTFTSGVCYIAPPTGSIVAQCSLSNTSTPIFVWQWDATTNTCTQPAGQRTGKNNTSKQTARGARSNNLNRSIVPWTCLSCIDLPPSCFVLSVCPCVWCPVCVGAGDGSTCVYIGVGNIGSMEVQCNQAHTRTASDTIRHIGINTLIAVATIAIGTYWL